MKDWLFNSDPYFMAYEVIPTYLASILPLYTLQPTKGPRFFLLILFGWAAGSDGWSAIYLPNASLNKPLGWEGDMTEPQETDPKRPNLSRYFGRLGRCELYR